MNSTQRTMRLPVGTLKRRYGMAIDIGGSLIKTVYMTPLDDATDGFHFKNFSRDELDKALVYLTERCTFLEPNQEICTTGVGVLAHKQQIQEALQVKISNFTEMTCFTTALKVLLRAFPETEIIHPPSQAAAEFLKNYVQQWKTMRLKRQEHANQTPDSSSSIVKPYSVKKPTSGSTATTHGDDTRQELASADSATSPSADSGKQASCAETGVSHGGEKDAYPYLVGMIGSGAGIIQVEENLYTVIDGHTRCGRMFLSLGALLTGEKTYAGLMALAARGDHTNVDVTAAHMKKGGDQGDLYQLMADDLLLYSFGQAMDKELGDFRKEDLARALLTTICTDLAQVLGLNYYVGGAKSLYVVGSFTDENRLCREELEIRMGVKNMWSSMQNLTPVELKFVKNGGYLGALGALIIGMEETDARNI